MNVKIHKLDCWGKTIFRVMTEDQNGTIFGRIMTDFETHHDAVQSIKSEANRTGIDYRIV